MKVENGEHYQGPRHGHATPANSRVMSMPQESATNCMSAGGIKVQLECQRIVLYQIKIVPYSNMVTGDQMASLTAGTC